MHRQFSPFTFCDVLLFPAVIVLAYAEQEKHTSIGFSRKKMKLDINQEISRYLKKWFQKVPKKYSCINAPVLY